jgi:MFS transporter, PAT family, solute carrier family 33 (acetyl-CoA transportor), member 1
MLQYFAGDTLEHELAKTHTDVWRITIMFTMLVTLAATQDIAVDGWAITILSKPNRSFASTCQVSSQPISTTGT